MMGTELIIKSFASAAGRKDSAVVLTNLLFWPRLRSPRPSPLQWFDDGMLLKKE
jgi:hypothetical protein